MVDFKRITDRAKDLVEKRGGTDSLKEDAAELRGIATGPGSFKEKAKAAVDALKQPGETADEPARSAADTAGATEQARAADKVEGEERGKHAHGQGQGHGRHRKGHGRHRGQGGGDGDPAG
jgi:hypothetical protein